MENTNDLDYALKLMRMQRHDFLNYLQVIYGYIQINKSKEVINYIKDINKHIIILSSIYNLNCSIISLYLNEIIQLGNKYCIETKYYCEPEYISEDIFSKNIDRNKRALKIIINKLERFLDKNEECMFKMINISICGKPDNFKLIVSNSLNFPKIKYDKNEYDECKSEMDYSYTDEVLVYKNKEVIAIIANFD